MKPVKHFASATGILMAAVCVLVLTSLGTSRQKNTPRTEPFTWAIAKSSTLERAFSQQGSRQPVPAHQTLSVFGKISWARSEPQATAYRTHALKQVPGDRLNVSVTTFQDETMRSANFRRQRMVLLAGCIAVLVLGLATLLGRRIRLARLHGARMAADIATLTAANEQIGAAFASANARAEQLEATLAGMGDGVSMVDAGLRLVEWNTQFPIIAGVPSEILRVGLPMEEILHAQVRTGQFGRIADPQAEVDRRMARLRVAPFGVVQRQRPDGHTIELRRNRLPDGGFVTLYTDVTDQKRAEEALRQAQAEAEAANGAKSRFIALVSHEIRTPLNTLLNTMRLLADSELAPAQKSLLGIARQSGDVLDGLICDILDMSQIEAGKLSIRPTLFDLRLLLEGCADMFAAQAADKGIRFHIDIPENAPAILLTDPARLRQVLLNLISNAVKYARPGDLRLIADFASQNDAIRLMVKDSGPMIDAEARGRLFRPFSRLDRPDSAALIGTGLGLSICSQLMILLGGSIGCDPWIRDNEQEGNVFWITLPSSALPLHPARLDPEMVRYSLERPSGVVSDAIPQRPLPRTRVLVAEDVLANQLVTATLLRRQGHLVDVACNGQAAVEAARRTPYDLIFMDVFMPGIGGPEATQIIRGLPEPAGSIPIIALTAGASGQDEAAFKASGMNGFLGKPISPNELLNALRNHVWAGCSNAIPSMQRTSTTEGMEKDVALLSPHRIKELRTNLSPRTFAGLVEECLLDLDQRLPALQQAIAEGVEEAIIAHAHTMIGVAAGYGMTALEVRLRVILAAARDGRLLSIEVSAMADLERVLGASAQCLRDIIHTTHA